mgnify:CR=1 FL=1
MANIKFSAFTAGGTGDAGTTQLVGYKTGDTSANYRYSISDLATMLSPSISTFYSADGTIGTTRKALITDTVQFRNAGDTSDIFKLNTDGTFTLGDGATHSNSTPNTSIVIGNNALVTSNNSVVIGDSATTGSGGNFNTVVGAGAKVANNTSFGLSIGYGAEGTGTNSVAVGYSTKAGGNGLAIGRDAEATGNPSITLNVSGSTATNSTANSFSVYMTSNTTPDFEVVGSGESTLNTSLKITGQAYTELHTEASAATITPDWNNGNVYTTELTNASTTFADPTNIKPGATYIIILKQDGTGSRTVSWGTKYKFPGGTAPTLTTGANKADVITLVAYSTDILMCTSVLDFVTS